jgi:hypothetical protein
VHWTSLGPSAAVRSAEQKQVGDLCRTQVTTTWGNPAEHKQQQSGGLHLHMQAGWQVIHNTEIKVTSMQELCRAQATKACITCCRLSVLTRNIRPSPPSELTCRLSVLSLYRLSADNRLPFCHIPLCTHSCCRQQLPPNPLKPNSPLPSARVPTGPGSPQTRAHGSQTGRQLWTAVPPGPCSHSTQPRLK